MTKDEELKKVKKVNSDQKKKIKNLNIEVKTLKEWVKGSREENEYLQDGIKVLKRQISVYEESKDTADNLLNSFSHDKQELIMENEYLEAGIIGLVKKLK